MNRLRRFTSLCITLSFFMMSYTGILLFIAPKGRVANWTNWHLLGLDRTQYTNLHVTFMVLFLVGILIHLYLNWNILLGYLKNEMRTFSLWTKEFLLALAFNLAFLFGTLYYWMPFDAFLDFEDTIKSSWEKTFSSQAPYGHAELSTLEEFALRTNSDVTLLVQKLTLAKLKGIDKTRSINDIAKDNGYSPAQLFEIIATTKIPMTSSSTMGGGGGGYGKLSLRDASEKYGFTMEQAMLFLREKGLDVQESTSLKEISDSLHVKPIELLDQLKTLSQNKETR